MMEREEKTEEINKKHKKYKEWLVAFRLNTLIHYTAWGADSTDGKVII